MLLEPAKLSLEQIQTFHAGAITLELAEHCRAGVAASAAVVQRAAAGDAPVYGVNTGFGKLANQRISATQLDTLQLNLIRSHSVGVGEPLGAPVMRLMLALKAASLARGHSGVRPVVIDTLLALDWVGQLEDGRDVLLVDLDKTSATPLIDALLLEPAASVENFRKNSQIPALNGRSLLQKQ